MPEINQNLADVKDEDMDERSGWRAIPSGEYRFVCESSVYKPTSNGTGHVLGLKWVCAEPDSSGTKLFDYLTLVHPNADTVRIAKARLKMIALAVRHPTPDFVQRSEELHGIPVIIKVEKRKAPNPRYADAEGFENAILSYKSPVAAAAQAPAQPTRPADDIPF